MFASRFSFGTVDFGRPPAPRLILPQILLAFVACTAAVVPAVGQVIEFEPPREIIVDESRLIVTFADTVSLGAARVLVEALGTEVEEIQFRPVTVWALFDSTPDPDPLVGLRSDQRVHRVRVWPPSAAAGVWVSREDGSRRTADYSTHALQVEFGQADAGQDPVAVVRAYFPALEMRVERGPNELIVRLPENAEGLVAELEADPRVRYVTYFHVEDSQSME